jgi:hypothetical protein
VQRITFAFFLQRWRVNVEIDVDRVERDDRCQQRAAPAWNPTPTITIASERIDPLAKFRETEASNHAPSWADFIVTMVGFKVFGTHNEAEDPKFLAQLESMGVTRARLMMNTNGFPIGAAPGSLSSGDRIKP